MSWLTAPAIYSLIVLLVIVDLWVSLDRRSAFAPTVSNACRDRTSIRFDHRHLAYLNRVEALNCMFCSYANGLIGFVREISSRTKQYWCPIKNVLRVNDPLHRDYRFLKYGGAVGYRTRPAGFRDTLRA